MPSLQQHIINLFFPVTCIQCGSDLAADDNLRVCSDCWRNIKQIGDIYCQKCGSYLPDGGALCYTCKKNPKYYFEYLRAYGMYDGVLRDLIHKFKYKNRDYLSRFLGKLLKDTIQKHKELIDVDYIIPVPMHWFKKLLRGYNQTELLALNISKYYGKAVLNNSLIRTKYTNSQIKLKKEERMGNIKGCFSVKYRETLKNKRVLLVDDVCTTGATINECSKALKKAGASKIYAVAVARD